jgi:hypothetical protein
MRKKSLLNLVLLVFALVTGAGNAWADYEAVYTLDGTITGGTSAYAEASEITQDGMDWLVVGNTTTNPWRIGGKSLDGVDRDITGLTMFSEVISKITVNHGGTTSDKLSVNSVTLTVATDADFTDVIDEVVLTPAISKNTEGSFDFEPTSPLTEWAKDSYYKITINVSNSQSSNYAFQVSSIVFYTEVTKTATTTTIDASGITNTNASLSPVAGQLTASVTAGGTSVEGATVTWSSSDENVAIVDAEGNVTLVAEGTTTITASYAGDADYSASSDTYELTVSDPRIDAGLAYAAENQTITVGATLNAPELTNPNSLAVTYSSSDEAIATVDAEGNVTGVAIGSVTISATFDGDETYKPGSASYTLIVMKEMPEGALFYEGVSGYTGSSDSGTALTPTSTSLDSDNWASFTKVYPGKVISGDTDGHLKFGTGSATGQAITNAIALTGSGKLTYKVQRYDSKESGNLTISVTGATASGDLDVTGTAEWEEKTVLLTGATGEVVIKFETAADNKRIRVDDILVTAAPAAVTTTVTAEGLATFVGEFNLDFSAVEGLAAYKAKVDGNNIAFTKVTAVPAGEGVLLRATTDLAGDTRFEIPVIEEAAALTDNDFIPGTGATVASSEDVEGTTYYNYILSKKSGSDELSFYLANNNTVAVGRAYLRTTAAPGEARFTFSFDDEVTGISAMQNDAAMNHAAYNLNGQRVNKLTKGLFIQNGKKVVIK